MKKFKTRMTAFVVVVLMLVAIMPVMAFAADSEFTTQPKDATALVGKTATFSVEVSETVADASPTYQWKVDKGDGDGFVNADGESTAASYTTPAVTDEMDGYEYRCVVTYNTTETAESASAFLTVVPATTPVIETQPTQGAAVNEGTNIQLTVAMATNAEITSYSYRWEVKDGESWISAQDGSLSVLGYTSDTLTIVAPTYGENGTAYRCVVTAYDGEKEVLGTVTSDEVAIKVNEPAAAPEGPEVPDVTVAFDEKGEEATATVLTGEEVTLYAIVDVKAGSELTYQWTFTPNEGEEANIPGATEATYTIDAATAEDAGTYNCTVVNTTYQGKQAEAATAATLTVNARTQDIVIDKAPEAATVFVGEDATFTVEASTQTGAALTYQWQVKRAGSSAWTDIEGATSATLTVEEATLAQNGYEYQCIITNKYVDDEGVEQTETATTTAVALTVEEKSQDIEITKDLENVTVIAGETVTLSVEASVEAGDALSYQWYVKEAGAGDFILMNGATDASYTVNATALANEGDVYKCTITNTVTKATTDSAEAALTILDPAYIPAITTQPVSVEQETGKELKLSVVAAGSNEEQELTYQWQKMGASDWENVSDGAGISGATTAELTITAATEANNGQYRCVVAIDGAENGEQAISEVATVNIWTADKPYFVTDLEANVKGYVGGSVTLSVEAKVNPSADLYYQWYVDADGAEANPAVAIKGANSASYTIEDLTDEMTGAQYYCEVFNAALTESLTAAGNPYAATSAKATLAVEEATEPVTPEMFPTEESGLAVDAETGLVTGLAATADTANTAADVISMFTATQGASIVIKDAAGNEVAEDAAVGTGYTVNLVAADGTTAQSVTLVIKGDVNGDGLVGIGDLVLAAQGNTLEGAYAVAADMNEDGAVGIGDLVLLAQA